MLSDPIFGLPLTFDAPTIACLVLGILIVGLLSIRKFAETTAEKAEDDFVAQLLPKYLATKDQYSRAMIGYISSMVGILCLLSAVGPRLLELSPELAPFRSVAPVGFALLLVGALTNIPASAHDGDRIWNVALGPQWCTAGSVSKLIAEETTKWAKVVKCAGIKAD